MNRRVFRIAAVPALARPGDTVHDVQARTPAENLPAMFRAIGESGS